jgi:Zn-dependent M28 family amino/carboxypeptidase
MANVLVDLPVASDEAGKAPIIVLCAHYETKRTDFEFVGANDGASGVAVLLELARVLAAAPRPVAYRLVFLDGEEAMRWAWRDPDNRYGSRHHVAELKRTGLIERVKACVVIDLVGDSDLQLTTDQASDERLLEAFFSAAREAGLGRHVDGERMPVRDDHLSFMEAGIRSVDLIDLQYGPDNDYWHSPEDTLEHVSRESLGVIGRIVLAGLPKVEALVREVR